MEERAIQVKVKRKEEKKRNCERTVVQQRERNDFELCLLVALLSYQLLPLPSISASRQ